ncbi:CYFA0S12e03488g1_1 [Cyberlindnera fabianii]|uniref:CYFA0S12e03488g1_1 n=1 Tax=Cyberlindnera fabianii TaxID=36022 RepID=A0A061B2M1_CYBFA|nr:CYFA0S12e03488g1_1 [Cyberlindnera fabianii]
MVSDDFKDELSAIEAIYPECVTQLNEGLIELKIPGHEEFKLRVTFPETYPESEMPHILQVQAKGHDEQYLQTLFEEVLASVYVPGNVCVFDFLTEMEGVLYVEDESETSTPQPEPQAQNIDPLEGWTMSDPVIDRASTFVAFSKEVHSEDDVFNSLSALKTDRKIAKATHNMVAYRIQNPDGTRLSDCDDDGETAAGGRMLHLLTIMDAWNCLVVVSRWFGGIHLGPDRFKHINSTAREAVIKGGFYIDNKKKKSKK